MSSTGDVVRLVNQLRVEEGLPPLVGDKKLARVAVRRATHCARKGKISHSGWTRALRNAGLRAGVRAYGENLAQGQDRGADAVRDWLASPGHRENMFSREYRRIGIGVAEGYDDRFWCQLFSS